MIFFANAGCAVIFLKTIRSRPWQALPSPNMAVVIEQPHAVSTTLDILSEVTVTSPGTNSVGCHGLVNSWGMPSDAPDEWAQLIRDTTGQLRDGQALVVSVVGSASKDDSPDVLIEDFVSVAVMAKEAGATIIELNLSCPNCYGREGEVFRDPALCGRIAAAVRAAVGQDIRILLKLGYAPRALLEELVAHTHRFVNGYTAINTLPVAPVERRQYGPLPAFGDGRKKAGLSGAPLLPYSTEVVKTLHHIRMDRGGRNAFAIVGCGGIASPANVVSLIDAGADIVAAATVFFDDPLFALRAHRHLEKHVKVSHFSREAEEELAFSHLRIALRRPSLRDKPQAKQIGLGLFITWSETNATEMATGVRRSNVPSPDQWEARILTHMASR